MAGFVVVGEAGRTGRTGVDILTVGGHHVTVAGRRPRVAHGGIRTVGLELTVGADPAHLAGVDGVVVNLEPSADPEGEAPAPNWPALFSGLEPDGRHADVG